MYRERIRATPLWKKDAPRYDCVLVENDPGFAELRVARAHLLFSVEHEGVDYPCALVEWFPTVGHRLLAAPKGVVRGAATEVRHTFRCINILCGAHACSPVCF